MEYIDLHVHSNASDGTYTPAELVRYANEKGLYAFALTDHDTIDGIEEAMQEAEKCRVKVIPGIELSSEYEGKDIHIVGLFIDYKQLDFLEQLEHFRASRDRRNEKMVKKLQEQGFDITLPAMEQAFPDAVLTRAHFARYLLDQGYVKDMKEAFDKYLGDKCPCYVPREKVTPMQAIRLIKKAGGTAVLAHPLLYHLTDEKLAFLVTTLKKAGLDAIEAIYSSNTGMDESNMKRLARANNLAVSGGSDFHGSNKPLIDLGTGKGNLKISKDLLKGLAK